MKHYLKNAVVLLSGGMDSATALAFALQHYTSNEVLALSFNYGQRHRMRELQASESVAQFYEVKREEVALGDLGRVLGGSALTDPSIAVPEGHYEAESMKATVVPNRNAMLLSIAFGVARATGAHEIFFGAHSGDHAIYPDCRASFLAPFQEAMDQANDDIYDPELPNHLSLPQLVVPFIDKTKADIVTAGHLLAVPYQLTYSCYKGERYHCGKCGTCTERIEAFNLSGIMDPTVYAHDKAAHANI